MCVSFSLSLYLETCCGCIQCVSVYFHLYVIAFYLYLHLCLWLEFGLNAVSGYGIHFLARTTTNHLQYQHLRSIFSFMINIIHHSPTYCRQLQLFSCLFQRFNRFKRFVLYVWLVCAFAISGFIVISNNFSTIWHDTIIYLFNMLFDYCDGKFI